MASDRDATSFGVDGSFLHFKQSSMTKDMLFSIINGLQIVYACQSFSIFFPNRIE